MPALAELRGLLRGSGFRRLTGARLLSQLGDGVFQAGLASELFFNPTEAATKGDIAMGFLLLLAPFTLVGPFVGPLIDRWQRQRILLVGNLVRLVLAVGVAACLLWDAPTWLLFATALLTLSINRFLLAAMTAAIPRVVEPQSLLAANSILPTLGTIAAAVGGAAGFVVAAVAPGLPSEHRAVAALLSGAVIFGLSSWAATLIARTELGPLRPLTASAARAQFGLLFRGLRDGARYLGARRTPFHALLVMAAQRLLYGLMFMASLLISRHILADDPESGGLGEFGIILAAAGVGFGLAAALTPTLGRRFSRHHWVLVCLIVGAAGQAFLSLSSAQWALLTAAVVVSFAVQGAKIAVDTIVQRDTEDAVRGRAFTLYDMAYNTAFVASAGIGALVLPTNGYAPAVMLGITGFYITTALLWANAPTEPRPAPPGLIPEDPESARII